LSSISKRLFKNKLNILFTLSEKCFVVNKSYEFKKFKNLKIEEIKDSAGLS